MKFKPIRFKPMKIHFNLDSDRDFVPDFKDCRPFNPFMQHISDTTKQRILAQPIYVSDDPEHVYHVLDPKAKKYAPRARQEMLSAIKKFPTILGQLEASDLPKTYKYIHRYKKRPLRIATQIEQDIFREKEVMNVGVQPYQAIHQLTPFAKRMEERQTEAELKYLKPYTDTDELPPEAFDMIYSPSKGEHIINYITKTSIKREILDTLYICNKDIGRMLYYRQKLKRNPSDTRISVQQLKKAGLISQLSDGRYSLTEQGKKALHDLRTTGIWRNPEVQKIKGIKKWLD